MRRLQIWEGRTRRAGRAWLTGASVALALAGLGALAPRVSAQKADDTVTPAAKTPEKRGLQVVGDDSFDANQAIKTDFVISVSVVGEPDPSGNYKVDQSGNVSVKYAGIMSPVSVKGLTPAQAADAIAKFLKTYIKNPQVTVSIVDVPRPIVFVGGAVRSPGPVVIAPDTTLVDVLSKTEWTDNADLSQVRLTRREIVDGKEQQTIRVINFDRYIKISQGSLPDETQNPVLRDKDRVFVGLKSLGGNGVVSVGGEVIKPQMSIPLRTSPPMTVREIINLVGGTNQTANRKSISIRRATTDRPLIVDLDKAEQGDLVNNIELRPDDAVYVEKLENNAYINLNGGFVKPGKFVYDKRTTLTQAIMEAGGIAPFAKEKDGKVYRHPDNDPKNTRVISFNWQDIQKSKFSDIELLPGDTVWIAPGLQPKPGLDLFGVLGALTSGAYLFNSFSNRYR